MNQVGGVTQKVQQALDFLNSNYGCHVIMLDKIERKMIVFLAWDKDDVVFKEFQAVICQQYAEAYA